MLLPLVPDIARINRALTSRYHEWILWEPEAGVTTLSDLLQSRLPEIDPSSWAARLDLGGVHLNGYPTLTDTTLSYPARIQYYEPIRNIDTIEQRFHELSEKNVIYHDSDIAFVYKPAGLPTMPAKEQRLFSLKAWLDKYFNFTVHLASRLDMSTRGIIPVSLSARMHKKIQQAYENREVKKDYLLASHSIARWSSHTIDAPIGPCSAHSILRQIDFENGQTALTDFNYLAQLNEKILYKASPKTGRTHQIRLHAAALGIPIIGDNFYNAAENPELHLTCYRLSWIHPFNGHRLQIAIPSSLLSDWELLAVGFISQADDL